MVDVDILSQLIDSMSEATTKLESAIQKNNTNEANKLRTFIFDLHTQIEQHLSGGIKNV